MEFDEDDIAWLQANNNWVDVIMHEVGHVLGIGTMWLTSGPANGPKIYDGQKGKDQWTLHCQLRFAPTILPPHQGHTLIIYERLDEWIVLQNLMEHFQLLILRHQANQKKINGFKTITCNVQHTQ